MILHPRDVYELYFLINPFTQTIEVGVKPNSWTIQDGVKYCAQIVAYVQNDLSTREFSISNEGSKRQKTESQRESTLFDLPLELESQ